MPMNGVIYGLSEPYTGELRYVGQTAQDPRKRLSWQVVPWLTNPS